MGSEQEKIIFAQTGAGSATSDTNWHKSTWTIWDASSEGVTIDSLIADVALLAQSNSYKVRIAVWLADDSSDTLDVTTGSAITGVDAEKIWMLEDTVCGTTGYQRYTFEPTTKRKLHRGQRIYLDINYACLSASASTLVIQYGGMAWYRPE